MKDTSLVNKHDVKFASSLTDKLFTQTGAFSVYRSYCPATKTEPMKDLSEGLSVSTTEGPAFTKSRVNLTQKSFITLTRARAPTSGEIHLPPRTERLHRPRVDRS